MIDTDVTPAAPAEFHDLINRACDSFNLKTRIRDGAKRLEKDCLLNLSFHAACGDPVLSSEDTYELASWGMEWKLSKFACIRALAK